MSWLYIVLSKFVIYMIYNDLYIFLMLFTGTILSIKEKNNLKIIWFIK